MLFVYNFIVLFAAQIVKLLAFLSPKMKLFVNGRKAVFQKLQTLGPNDKTIWFHAASLGEYEQGLPVMEKIKSAFPGHKIILTFFSPSGYEVRKSNPIADLTVYLPLDTKSNAKRFIDLVKPEMVFFIKYEYWPNYLDQLKKRQIKTYLISGIFRKNQAFFKWYGGFYRNALNTFGHFFVQNETSKKLVGKLGFTNVTISGDTRFDRVVSILQRDNTLDFIENFKANKLTVVIGSSWPIDESFLANYINTAAVNVKFIIAPHNIKAGQIDNLQSQITKPVVLFSGKEGKNLAEFSVFIIDTIGILTKIYSYADIAYVGGGFGNPGVHNILEPATFGVPIVIGPNYAHFAEATALVHMGGCTSVSNQAALSETFDNLIFSEDIRHEKGHICATFVQMNKGATTLITEHILNENLN